MKKKLKPLREMPFTRDQYELAVALSASARENAYAPYSKYLVGAAILCADGSLHAGCNVETANYDPTHAEEAALCAMSVKGRRDPILCVCVGGLKRRQAAVGGMSCGKCRQALYEFHQVSGMDLWLAVPSEHAPRRSKNPWFIRISDLLEFAFGPADVGIDVSRYRK